MRNRQSDFALTVAVGATLVAGGREAWGTVLRGQVVLHGAQHTAVSFVESRVRISAGEPITFELLKQAEERLVASDLFEKVSITIDLPREEAARRMYVDTEVSTIDVQVTLEEKQTWIVFPNASVGSGDAAIGVVYADQSLRGRGLQLVTAGQYGEQKSYFLAAFRDPLLSFAPLTYAIAVTGQLENIRFYDQHQPVEEVETAIAGGEAQVGWVYTSHFRASVGALYHRQWIGHETILVPPPVLYNTREGNIVTVQLAMIYDNTSAPEGLRRGTAVTLKNELSDSFWKSDFDYFKIDFLVELYGYFHKTYPSALLHSEFVYPTSGRGVPLTEIIRAGGAALRGYFVNEFHGDTLVTIQLEEAMPLFKFWKLNFAGAIFADAGALLERHPGGVAAGELVQAPTPSLKDFHTGAGAGLRILIPGIAIPALKLDLGYGFDVQDIALIFSIARGAL